MIQNERFWLKFRLQPLLIYKRLTKFSKFKINFQSIFYKIVSFLKVQDKVAGLVKNAVRLFMDTYRSMLQLRLYFLFLPPCRLCGSVSAFRILGTLVQTYYDCVCSRSLYNRMLMTDMKDKGRRGKECSWPLLMHAVVQKDDVDFTRIL